MNKKLLYLILLLIVWVLSFFVIKAHAEAPDLTYDQRLDFWIQQVRWEESRGHDMLVILDTNNRYSYGCLQFQMATWLMYSKKYKVEGEMMDCNKQIELTKYIIRNEPDGWRNWYTTVVIKKVGKPPIIQ